MSNNGNFSSVLGAALLNVQAVVYLAQSGDSWDLNDVQELRFAFSGRHLRLRCCSDGESLVTDAGELKAVDMGESGLLEVVDLVDMPIFSQMMQQTCNSIKLVVNRDAKLVGASLGFDGNDLLVCNLGDELRILGEFSREVFPPPDFELSTMSI